MDGWGWTGSRSTPGCLWKLLPLWLSPLSLQIFSMMLPAVLGFHWNLSFPGGSRDGVMVSRRCRFALQSSPWPPWDQWLSHFGKPQHLAKGLSKHRLLSLALSFWFYPSGVEPRMCVLFVCFLREISIDSSVREGTFLHLSSFLKMYLFIFGCAGSWLLRSGSMGATLLLWLLTEVTSLAAEHGLWLRLQQLWREDLVAPASGIFLDQGSNPCPLHWQADF